MHSRNDQYSSQNIKTYNPRAYPKRKKCVISIHNFDRQSQDVVFTEPATIEAINRLGFEMSEFNFRPLHSFAISDYKLQEEMFQKFLKRRQKLIDQTVNKRKEILEEEQETRISQNSHYAPISQPKSSSLENLESKSNNAFRKLALNRLHDFLCYQNDNEINNRISEKFQKLDIEKQQKHDLIAGFRSEKQENYPKSQRFNSAMNSPSQRSQVSEANISTPQTKPLYRTKQTPKPSSNYSKIIKKNTITPDTPGPQNYHETQVSQVIKLHQSHIKREERTKKCLERRASLERENQAQLQQKIQEREDRFNISSANRKRAYLEQLKDKGQLYKFRSKSARRRREDYEDKKQQETYESYMINQVRTEERMKDINNQKQYNATMFRNKQEEHLQKVKHSQNALKYQNEQYKKQLKEERRNAQNAQIESEAIKSEMREANLLVKNRRDKINQAFDNLKGFDDVDGMNRIQKLMGYNDQEMKELISTAFAISQETPHNRKV